MAGYTSAGNASRSCWQRLLQRQQSNSDDNSVVTSVFFFQAEDGIRDVAVTGVQTCALPIYDLAHLYSFSYYPKTNPNRGWRSIKVQLVGERLKQYHVRTRNGYRLRPNRFSRSEEHTSELQSRLHLVCRLLLEKTKPFTSWIT